MNAAREFRRRHVFRQTEGPPVPRQEDSRSKATRPAAYPNRKVPARGDAWGRLAYSSRLPVTGAPGWELLLHGLC